jgi:hypothetical protein
VWRVLDLLFRASLLFGVYVRGEKGRGLKANC